MCFDTGTCLYIGVNTSASAHPLLYKYKRRLIASRGVLMLQHAPYQYLDTVIMGLLLTQ